MEENKMLRVHPSTIRPLPESRPDGLGTINKQRWNVTIRRYSLANNVTQHELGLGLSRISIHSYSLL